LARRLGSSASTRSGQKYYLSNLPAEAYLKTLAATIKALDLRTSPSESAG